MENALTLQKHNFDVAKSKIQKLAHTVPSKVAFRQFPTSGSIFSCNDHNITGKEANEHLVSPLQTTLIDQNSRIKDLFIIADEIYKTFDYLDREYIQGIVASVEAATVASNQAKSASDKAQAASDKAYNASQQALNASNEVKVVQTDIKKTIEALKATVATLKIFKDRVSTQIDSISSTSNTNRNKIQNIENKIAEISKISVRISGLTTEQHNSLISSISDIDTIWSDVDKRIRDLDMSMNESLASNVAAIVANMTTFRQSVESQMADDKATLEQTITDLQQKNESKATELANIEQQHKSEIDKALAELNNYAETIDSHMSSNMESISQRISDLDKSMSENLASNVATIVTNLATLQQENESKVAELANIEQKHKSEIDKALAEFKIYAESLESRLTSNVESIDQRICDLDKSMSESLASNVATIVENMMALQQSVESQMADDKATLKQAILDLKQANESKATELANIELNHKKELDSTIEELREEITYTNYLNEKKFKWVFGIAGISMLINIIVIILYVCGMI